jgi:tetratricopeptide (TPR) repeat protein
MPKAVDRWKNARLCAGVFLLLAGLSGCASLVPQTMALRNAWPPGVAQQAELVAAPFFPQQDYQCGPAALATALVHAGARVTPEELVTQVYVPARQGSLQIEMLAASRRHGRVAYQLAPRFDDLLREVAAGNPVIVLQDIGLGPMVRWHYAVVIGFDYAAGELYLRSGETKRLAMPFTVFEYTWRKSRYWAMVTVEPGRIPITATESAYLAAIAAMERASDGRAAVPAYVAFLERWPESVAASVGLANGHYARGALADAEVVLRRALARHPDSVVVLNNLAQTLSDLGRNDEALVLVERAAQRSESPFAATVRETHALILERLGRAR